MAIGKIIRQLCEWKGVNIFESEACPDHIHIFAEIPPKMAVTSFMGYLKGKSTNIAIENSGAKGTMLTQWEKISSELRSI